MPRKGEKAEKMEHSRSVMPGQTSPDPVAGLRAVLVQDAAESFSPSRTDRVGQFHASGDEELAHLVTRVFAPGGSGWVMPCRTWRVLCTTST